MLEEDQQKSGFETSDLEGLIGYNLKRAYLIVQEDFRRTLEGKDLPARLFSTLSLVAQNPNISQIDLARKLGTKRSGIVAMIDDLEERGLAERKPYPGDRRRQALVLTAKGQEHYQDVLEKIKQHEVNVFSGLSNSERENLLSTLQKFRSKGE